MLQNSNIKHYQTKICAQIYITEILRLLAKPQDTFPSFTVHTIQNCLINV